MKLGCRTLVTGSSERSKRGTRQWRTACFAPTRALLKPTKAVMPRARWLEVLPNYVVHDYVIEDEVADVDDDVAVVLHRDRMPATVRGEDRSGTFIISDVWRRGRGGWHVWRRHSTPLAVGRLPGVDGSHVGGQAKHVE